MTKLYVHFSGAVPLIVEGDRLTPDRPCEYPFEIDTTVKGLELVQKVADFAYQIGMADSAEMNRMYPVPQEPMVNAPKEQICDCCHNPAFELRFAMVQGQPTQLCVPCHDRWRAEKDKQLPLLTDEQVEEAADIREYTPPLSHPVPMAAVPADQLKHGDECEVPLEGNE